MCYRLFLRISPRWMSLFTTCCVMMLWNGQAAADRSFTVSLYQGVSLADGMVCSDPTVLTVMIGEPVEIAVIAAPPVDPLFTFPTPVDFFVQLTGNLSAPLELVFTEEI